MSSSISLVALRRTRDIVNSVATKPPIERKETSDKSLRKQAGKNASATTILEVAVLESPSLEAPPS